MPMRRPIRRGLSLLELILATTITAMVAAAIAGMLSAVTAGVGSSNDSRAAMIRTNAGNTRIGSYVAPSRCLLGVYADSGVALWQDDTRQSGTVHATEIRWLLYDSETESLNVYFVEFPDEWMQAAKDLADIEYPSSTDWITVLETYQTAGHISIVPLVDALSAVAVTADDATPLDARQVYFDLDMRTGNGVLQSRVASVVHYHERPDA